MVLHELGHAMGIPVNGTGIMTGNISPDIDLDDPMLHFEVADAVKIKAVLEKVATFVN